MSFLCDKCGECCRNIGGVAVYADLDRGDGVCRHLRGDLCSIYKTRPLKCRVDDAYAAFFAPMMTKDEFYELNAKACEALKQNKHNHIH